LEHQKLLLDVRTILPEDESTLVKVLMGILAGQKDE
jgi:hypothetical protein